MKSPLLEVEDLYVTFRHKQTKIQAVRGASFILRRGQTLGLVGESGCGKTSIGKAITGLNKYASGSILFEGEKLTPLQPHREIQMIFQDPYSSLDPRMTIEESLLEPLQIYRIKSKPDRKRHIRKLLDLVGLSKEYLACYPHELSGGQRQRICIARALVLEPKCIVCDEPIAALDVSIQAQIINLLNTLQEELGHAYLFISHDLAVVKHICDHVAVMHFGSLVEYGKTSSIFTNPRHEYTQTLLNSARLNLKPQELRQYP